MNKKVKCVITVEAKTDSEAKALVDQMMYDYYKHYVDSTKIVKLVMVKNWNKLTHKEKII